DMSSDSLPDADLITALYVAFLGREPEPLALNHLGKALAEGTLDSRSLIAVFSNCDEYRQRRSIAPLLYPPGHYYSPIVNIDEYRADAARVFDRSRRPAGIDLNEAGQLALLPIIRSFACSAPLPALKPEGMLYYSHNDQYGIGDAAVLAAM